MLVLRISYLVCIYWAFTTCLVYLISFDLYDTLWETHYCYLHFKDEKTEISHKENSLCSMASGFQKQDKSNLSVPWKEENTLLVFQIAISHVPLTSRCLHTHPRSSWLPLMSHCHCSSSCDYTVCCVPPWPTCSPFICSLLSQYVFLYQALRMGSPVFLSLGGLYFFFLPTWRNFIVLWI